MRIHSMLVMFIALSLLTPLLPSVTAYSTAWCGACHQLVVVNDGVFAFNGSNFKDLTWELQARGLREEEFLDFIQTIGVVNAGNLTLIYSFPYDMLYMAVYSGKFPVVMKSIIGWYVGGVRDFLLYNGSVFFVASTGGDPHDSSDAVYRLNPTTLNVTGHWGLAWDARNRVAPENAGITPYAWVHLGLDEHGRLWARVDMMMPNTTLYYLYDGKDFVPVNASPKLHLPEPSRGPFTIHLKRGITYYLPTSYWGYTPTRYFLVENGTTIDVTEGVKSLAYSTKPLNFLYGSWDWWRKRWVISFKMYGLPISYVVDGDCRSPLDVNGLPLTTYNGSYVLLRNGTLSWKNYTVKTPTRSEYWADSSASLEEVVSVEVYLKNSHPVIAFPWEVYGNKTIKKGFIAYEVTEEGFVVFNTTNETELGQNLVPPWFVPNGKGGSKWNNIPGTLIVNEPEGTAYLITRNGKVSVNFTVAGRARRVVVGNGTFLMVGSNDAYIVPPYDRPVSVLSLDLCSPSTSAGIKSPWGNKRTLILVLGAGMAAVFVTAIVVFLRKEED